MRSNESAEMYLETILLLKEKKAYVRAIDIVHETGYTKPSVSRAMKLLREAGHISVDESGYITLAESGAAIAQKVVERHRCLSAFLCELGVSPEIAVLDACKMEHIISDMTFDCMKQFLEDRK